MTRKRQILYGLLALTIGSGAFFIFIFIQAKITGTAGVEPGFRQTGTQASNQAAAHLYFADKNNLFLLAEERILYHTDGPTDFSRKIIEALIKGPSAGLERTIPIGTTLRALYITSQGVCYVDLSAAVKEEYPGGAESELLTIYSIVNSLILNVPEIQAVKILIDGQETDTLAGHIDLHDPIKANMLLIR
jgi:spore germination protein GerM